MLKKCFCILLCVVILSGGVSFCIAAADDALPFLVATDLHYKPMPAEALNNFPGDKYYCADTSANLLSESYAVLQAFLRQAAESDAGIVLLCGDLTHDGTVQQHTDFARFLSDFERETGKKVFVISGNHDFHSRIPVDRFKEIYAEFGYSEALVVDEASCSYTADLSDRYRLLALDSTSHGGGGDGFTAERLQWAAAQAEKAKQDGKELIVIMHHNFLEHIPFQAKIMPAFIVRPELDMKTRFLNWGVRYVFTGHTHVHDVTSYTDKLGRTVYDVMTTSLNAYPCAYRSAVLTDSGLDMRTCRIDSISADDLPGGYTQELMDEMLTDFNKFALGCFRHSFDAQKNAYIGEDALAGILNRFVGEKLSSFLDPFFRTFVQTLFLPIYEPDTPDGVCLAQLSRALGLTVPETQYPSVTDLAFYFVCVLFEGDEDLPYSDPQILLVMQCVYTALYETMKNVNVQTRDAILADLRANLSDNALPYAVSAAGKLALGAICDDRLLEMTLLLLSPLIEAFSTDDGVPDNDGFLPAQSKAESPVLSFLRQIFGKISAFLQRYCTGIVRIIRKYPLFGIRLKAESCCL